MSLIYFHFNWRIESNSSRIDDIYFKKENEKTIAASLLKIELHLKKLKEITMQTINQLNNVGTTKEQLKTNDDADLRLKKRKIISQ